MKLPNADRAIVPEAKLRDYLLSPWHREGKSKARLFRALGYSQDNWQQLEADIRAQHLTQDAIEVAPDDFGRRWRIEAPLRGPSGSARIVTVWMIPTGREEPSFVTAYQARR